MLLAGDALCAHPLLFDGRLGVDRPPLLGPLPRLRLQGLRCLSLPGTTRPWLWVLVLGLRWFVVDRWRWLAGWLAGWGRLAGWGPTGGAKREASRNDRCSPAAALCENKSPGVRHGSSIVAHGLVQS